MKLLVNKLEIPKCRSCLPKSEHWSGEDIIVILGRDLLSADSFEFTPDYAPERADNLKVCTCPFGPEDAHLNDCPMYAPGGEGL